MPVSKHNTKCKQSEVDKDPCSCYGGAARRVGVFESIRHQLNPATTTHTTRAPPPNYVVTIDAGGYFFGSGLFFPAFQGNVSAAMREVRANAQCHSYLNTRG